MMSTVFTKFYDAPPIDLSEILRYAGVRGEAPELLPMLNECIDEIMDRLVYKVCYCELPVSVCGEALDLGFARILSKDLKKNLSGCDSIVLFAATVGIEPDRLITRYKAVSATRALFFQAIGAERIEALCDAFSREIAEQKTKKGRVLCPRFSPGYGDLPLELQGDIFKVLDCPRKIGLTLIDSFLMSPSKSVTAIMGVRQE